MVNKQVFHVILNFNTGEEVTRHGNITELPVTDVVIKSVERMASYQTMKVIKIHNRVKVIYRPTDWIKGGGVIRRK